MYSPVSGLPRIVSLEARDVRFPTSRSLDGSDAMHTDPDYSAAYVVLRTDADDGIEGHGLTFTSGRGTEVCVAAIRALEPFVVGRTPRGDRRRHARLLAQPRLRQPAALARSGEGRHPPRPPPRSSTRSGTSGPRSSGKPLWKLLVDLSPEELVACVDFRYIADALTPGGGARSAPRRAARERGSRAGDRRLGLPRLHDVRRLARLRRRQGRGRSSARPSRRASPT